MDHHHVFYHYFSEFPHFVKNLKTCPHCCSHDYSCKHWRRQEDIRVSFQLNSDLGLWQ
jgi:hypothetical protein